MKRSQKYPARLKNDHATSVLQNIQTLARSHPVICVALLLVVAISIFSTCYIVIKHVHNQRRIQMTFAIVVPTEADMKSLGASATSFSKRCWTAKTVEFGPDTITVCRAEMNAYFDDASKQQMESVLASEAKNIRGRGYDIKPSPTMVYTYGFGPSGIGCALHADFEIKGSHYGDRLDYPHRPDQRGHIMISCMTDAYSSSSY